MGFVLSYTPAFSKICFATPLLTFENSSFRKDWIVFCFEYLNKSIKYPSSIPYGCGLISFGSSGSLGITLGKIIVSLSGFT